MNQNIHQCKQCKNNFPEQEVYRIGIKQKHFFCRECAKNIKSECMWCGKELAKKEWKVLGGGSGIKSEEGKLAETINHDERHKEKHHKYYLICPEELHGKDWIKCCRGAFNRWWIDKGNQKRQEKTNKGWKECQGKAVWFKDPKTEKVLFDMDCWKLVPPGQKYCNDDMCIYYTAEYKGIDSDAKKRIGERWNQRDQEKYAKANKWWNSLSLAEKQAKLKKEEQHLNNLGLQRQRCWIERLDKNSILFENGKIYYDNIDKIPPSFLHDWGYPGYQWESVWKNEGNHSNTALCKAEVDKEINKKEISLQQAKEKGDNEMVAKLELQLQELKKQQPKNNSTSPEISPKNSLTPWIIGSSLLIVLGGFVYWVWKKNTKTRF